MSDKEVVDTVLDGMSLADLQDAKSAVVTNPPTLTPEKVAEVVGLFKYVEQNNGLRGVAHKAHITTAQARVIWDKMKSKIAELTPEPKDVEPIVDPVEVVEPK